jgi:tetratricopeptide (TPR) repeat protein
MAFVFGVLANPAGIVMPDVAPVRYAPPAMLRAVRIVVPLLGVWLAAATLPLWRAERASDQARALLADGRLIDSPEMAQRAAQFAREAIARDPRDASRYTDLADATVALADMARNPEERRRLYEEAIATYRRAIEVSPHDVTLIVALARTLDSIGRFAEAEQLYPRAFALDPNSRHVQLAWAEHLRLAGRLDEAEKAYRRAIEIQGHFAADVGLQRVLDAQKAAKPPAK